MDTLAVRFGRRVQELVQGVKLAAITCTKDVTKFYCCAS